MLLVIHNKDVHVLALIEIILKVAWGQSWGPKSNTVIRTHPVNFEPQNIKLWNSQFLVLLQSIMESKNPKDK